jgi:TonB family protein
MKRKIFLMAIATTFIAVACKNERGNDNHYDTTVVSEQKALPDNTVTAAPIDSSTVAVKSDSIAPPVAATAPTTTKNTTEKKSTATTIDTRTRKTSRKGRAILASLKQVNIDKMEADKEGVYNRAEIMPSYPGGEDALRKYIENHIDYPQEAMDNDVQGTVKLYFAVDEQGKISNPTVISSRIGYGLEDAALKVVRQMPRWTPGQVAGKNVKTRFMLPITYQIQ